MARRPLGWKVVEHVSHKKFSNGGVIVVKDDPDVIHVDNSSDLALSISLNDLENAALHIDGQSIDVEAPPDIIDVMSTDVARGSGGDGGGDDHPPPHQIPTGCGGCLGNQGKGTRKPNLGSRRTGRQHTRQETRNLGLKAITNKSGPVPIRFEFGDIETLMPLGEHAAHWLFDMRPHVESDRWPLIYAGIQQHLQKIYNGKKAALKEKHWIPDSDGTSLAHFRGSNTETGVPYTEDEIMAIVRRGKQRGHIPGVGRFLPGQRTVIPPSPPCKHSSDVAKLKKREKVLTCEVNMFMKLFRSDDKFSQMLSQLESQPEIGGGSRSGGCGDDEQGYDEDDGEDGEDEDDS
ncbi:hypothetical protein Tco_1151213 [Tanacetum coccineum]